MLRLICFIFIFFNIWNPAFAKSDLGWKYKSFPLLSKNSKLKTEEPYTLRVGKNKLSAIMSRESGTHRIWGIDQVYLNPISSTQKLFVKYDIEVSSKAPTGWIALNNGQIIHLKQKNKKYTAYFAQGFSKKDLFELQKQFKRNHVAHQPINKWWLPCANAEEVTSPLGDIYYSTEQTTAPSEPSSGFLARAENVMTCVGGQAIDNAVERGQALWESATWENVRNTAGNAWEAVPSLEEAGNGIAAGATWVWDRISNPSETWNRVVDSFDKTKQIFAQVYQEVSTALAGFRDLPPEIQDEIVCYLVAQLAVDGALGVALGATGAGATIAVARLLNRVRTLTSALASKMPRILLIIEQNPPDRVQAIRSLLEESVDGGGIQAVTPSSAPTSGGGLLPGRVETSPFAPGPDRDAMLARNGALNATERIAEAETALGRTLSEAERAALLRAHEVAPERGFGTYTRADLDAKMRILRAAGFTANESDLLMRSGLAGRLLGTPPDGFIKISHNSRSFEAISLANQQREIREIQTLIETQATISGNTAILNGVTFQRYSDAGGRINWYFDSADSERVQAMLRDSSTVSPRIPFAQRHPTEVVITQADTRFQEIVGTNSLGNSTRLRNMLNERAPDAAIGDTVIIDGVTFYRRQNNSRAPIWTFDISDTERVLSILRGP